MVDGQYIPNLFIAPEVRHDKTSYSPGKKELFRASLYVWYLQYWALYDDLVDFKLRAGVRYLSFSIDTAPECIL